MSDTTEKRPKRQVSTTASLIVRREEVRTEAGEIRTGRNDSTTRDHHVDQETTTTACFGSMLTNQATTTAHVGECQTTGMTTGTKRIQNSSTPPVTTSTGTTRTTATKKAEGSTGNDMRPRTPGTRRSPAGMRKKTPAPPSSQDIDSTVKSFSQPQKSARSLTVETHIGAASV